MEYTKKELVETLRKQISLNPTKAINALVTIYSYQTSDEKADGYTQEYNNVGFTGCDSQFLSSLAENYNKYGRLSENQVKCLMKLMPKYSAQLIAHSIMKGKIIKNGRKYIIAK